MTVASAAPAVPMPSTATNKRSPTILQMQAIVTDINGVLESPIPRNTAPKVLYAMIAREPMPQIRIYCAARVNDSAGAFISEARDGALIPSRTEAVTPMTANKAMPAPMMRPPSFAFPSPIFWPSSIVMPIARPMKILVTVIMTCEPVETADTSAVPANLPTTIRSTAPYMDCRKDAASIGIAKRIRGPVIGPSVNSIPLVSDIDPAPFLQHTDYS